MLKNKNIIKILKLSIGLVLFIWLGYSLYHQIQEQENMQQAIEALLNDWDTLKILFILLVIVLMLANWSVESLKWKMLLNETENMSFLHAFQSVLTGLAVSIITPNRVGEYLGRILFLKNTNKLKGISITIVGSFAQILVTGTFGILGLLYFVGYVQESRFLYILLVLSVISSVLMFYLLFNLNKIVSFCEQYSFLRKVKIYIEVIKRYDRKTLWRLIGYAFLRYLIYSSQFYILLRITHQGFLPIESFMGIWLIFWIIAVVPSFVIADVGVRGKTAVTFLAFVSSNVLGVLSASILLWFVNLILPALIGCFFMYRIKMFTEE